MTLVAQPHREPPAGRSRSVVRDSLCPDRTSDIALARVTCLADSDW